MAEWPTKPAEPLKWENIGSYRHNKYRRAVTEHGTYESRQKQYRGQYYQDHSTIVTYHPKDGAVRMASGLDVEPDHSPSYITEKGHINEDPSRISIAHKTLKDSYTAAQHHHVAQHYGLNREDVDALHHAYPGKGPGGHVKIHPDMVRSQLNRAHESMGNPRLKKTATPADPMAGGAQSSLVSQPMEPTIGGGGDPILTDPKVKRFLTLLGGKMVENQFEGSFKPGDRVVHPYLGMGRVTRVHDPAEADPKGGLLYDVRYPEFDIALNQIELVAVPPPPVNPIAVPIKSNMRAVIPTAPPHPALQAMVSMAPSMPAVAQAQQEEQEAKMEAMKEGADAEGGDEEGGSEGGDESGGSDNSSPFGKSELAKARVPKHKPAAPLEWKHTPEEEFNKSDLEKRSKNVRRQVRNISDEHASHRVASYAEKQGLESNYDFQRGPHFGTPNKLWWHAKSAPTKEKLAAEPNRATEQPQHRLMHEVAHAVNTPSGTKLVDRQKTLDDMQSPEDAIEEGVTANLEPKIARRAGVKPIDTRIYRDPKWFGQGEKNAKVPDKKHVRERAGKVMDQLDTNRRKINPNTGMVQVKPATWSNLHSRLAAYKASKGKI